MVFPTLNGLRPRGKSTKQPTTHQGGPTREKCKEGKSSEAEARKLAPEKAASDQPEWCYTERTSKTSQRAVIEQQPLRCIQQGEPPKDKTGKGDITMNDTQARHEAGMWEKTERTEPEEHGKHAFDCMNNRAGTQARPALNSTCVITTKQTTSHLLQKIMPQNV